MSRSPVRRRALPPASVSSLASVPEEVVGLEGRVAAHRPVEAFEEALRALPLRDEPLRHLGAVGVVGGQELLAIGGSLGAEAQDDCSRVVLLDLGEDQVGRAEERVDRDALWSR